jgi:hypothetical protein
MLDDYGQERVYLSKRNLLTLLSKLERFEKGEETKCAIVKHANPLDPYCSTIDEITVFAIPDEQYYTRRMYGEVHPSDDPKTEINIEEA